MALELMQSSSDRPVSNNNGTSITPFEVDGLHRRHSEGVIPQDEHSSHSDNEYNGNGNNGLHHDIDDTISSTAAAAAEEEEEKQSQHKLNTVLFAVIVFYNVSGGPFGIEEAVRSSGNFFALLGFLVMPFIWSVQEAVITAELGSAFPDAAGGMAWVEEAFGPAAGWMAGYLGWVGGATDNALYPVLFMDYLLEVWHGGSGEVTTHPVVRFILLSLASIFLAYINWLGLDIVGKMSVTICLIAMSPFIIVSIVGAFKVDPSRWFIMPEQDLTVLEDTLDDDLGGGFFPYAMVGGILLRPYLNSLFWNLNSFDAAASFSADVQDPERTFPRGMFWAVIMVIAGYFIPLLIITGASDSSQEDWVDGYLAEATSDIVGKWLGDWTVFAAAVSNIALFLAELSADSFQLLGMAERGHLPKLFAKRSRHGTPTNGIILGTFVIVIMGAANLEKLVEMLNFNYSISLLLEYCAFIKLRISRPDLHRPWKLPIGTVGCIVFITPTFLFTFIVWGLATYTTYIFSIAINLFGVLLYYAKKRGMWGPVVDKPSEYNTVQVQIENDEINDENKFTINGDDHNDTNENRPVFT